VTADPRRIKDLFAAALDLPDPPARDAFLDRECGPDAALRRRLAALLRAHDRPDPALDRPFAPPLPGDVTRPFDLSSAPTADHPGPAPSEGAGTVVAGRYKLLEPIGDGGMGTVWAAEQEQPVRRRVALKLIKAGMDSERVIARFEAERQALALMDHTSIAKVFDAGTTPAGRPYFAMELVKGVPVTTYCDELHLTNRERLLLFADVCRAVQHAHQKGVIHRDLKPSNVLVAVQDGKPVPKVIDFGLAKALYAKLGERSMYTEIGAVVGTLEYMAPEQAELSALDVDTRADLYALGALLYELLTGATPLARERLRTVSLVEALRMIREEDPPRPSTRLSASENTLAALAARRRTEPRKLGAEVRGELDWIVMKCLEKDRTRRYESAAGLAQDVLRYLADEPVEACPPSRWYRARKFCRRNRGGVAAAALLLLALSAGVVGTTAGLLRAGAERDKARDALAGETAARQEATEALDAATGYGLDTFFARQPAVGEREKRYLRNLLTLYEKAAARRGETEEARAMAARGRLRVARILGLLGERGEADESYRTALRHYRELARDYPGVPLYRREWGVCHLYLGESLKLKGQVRQAEEEFRAARDIHQRLVDEYPDLPLYLRDLWAGTIHLGTVRMSLDDHVAAEDFLVRALDIAGRIARHRLVEPGPGRWADEAPSESQYRVLLGNTHQVLGALYHWMGRRAESGRHYRESHAAYERLIRDHPTEWEYLWGAAASYGEAGEFLAQGPGAADAEPALRRSVELSEQLVSALPAVPAYRLALARRYRSLGHLLRERGDTRGAAALWAKAVLVAGKLEKDRDHAADSSQVVDGLLIDLDRASLELSQPDLPEYPLRELLRDRRRSDGADSIETADVMAELGLCLIRQRKYDEAEPLLRECATVNVRERPGGWKAGWAKSLLGGALLGKRRYSDAEQVLVAGCEAIRREEKSLPAHFRPRVGEVVGWLVRLYDESDRPGEAAKWRAERAKYVPE
jgi:tetratricopeptide (TPR) repeat protein